MFQSITEIKQACRARGGHWFDPDTMRFFGSRVHTPVYPTPWGAYFVTSEKESDGAGRFYSVRSACSQGEQRGSIETAGEFQGYASRTGAHRAAQRLAAQANAETK